MKNLSKLVAICSISAFAVVGSNEAIAASKADKDWPCEARKRPELSAAAIWSASEISETDRSWESKEEIAQLVSKLVKRRLSIEDAKKQVEKYAKGLKENKSEKLTLVFTGLFQKLNDERRTIVNGIVRFSVRQQALAESIKKTIEENQALQLKEKRTEEEEKRLAELEKKLVWDTRIFDDRERSLNYVCESPIIIEQRLFALGRTIQENLN